jgi:plastocyanin
MSKTMSICRLIFAAAMAAMPANAQSASTVDVRMQLQLPVQAGKHPAPSAVLWLKPLQSAPAAPFLPEHHYTLLQKNRMFAPHLLVIPVGSTVNFPNADPFFHNVFSLFDGKRFDLGLYEAGSTKAVTFSREGVSYIFCNIHPEMSAVVLTLSTSLYDVADSNSAFHLSAVPDGDYELHVWIEGVAQPALSQMTRRVHIAPGSSDLGAMPVPALQHESTHTNLFGQPYDSEAKPTY